MRSSAHVDSIETVAGARGWLERFEVDASSGLPALVGPARRACHSELVRLRDAVRETLAAVLAGDRPTEAALSVPNANAQLAPRRPLLAWDGRIVGEFVLGLDLATALLAHLAEDSATVLDTRQHHQAKRLRFARLHPVSTFQSPSTDLLQYPL
jgi:anti-sigma factor RsiW